MAQTNFSTNSQTKSHGKSHPNNSTNTQTNKVQSSDVSATENASIHKKQSDKKFNTIETLRILLEHPNIMFNVIRNMDSNKVRFINESILAQEILQYSSKLSDTERQRITLAFDTDNLLQSHILMDKDIYQGTCRLSFQEGIISIFRLCENSLYQELTDSKLKSRLASLWRLQERVNNAELSFIDNDPDYLEFIDDLVQQLSELLSLLKQNIDRMQSLGRDLEAMSSQTFTEILSGSENVAVSQSVSQTMSDTNTQDSHQLAVEHKEKMLARITHLFERHIKPTQNFLNHSTRLAKGSNLFATLDSFKQAFAGNDKHALSSQMLRYSMSFSNIFVPITDVAHQVDQFLRKTRSALLQSNAMEHFHQKLMLAYDKTLDRNLNKTKIDNSLVKEFDFINNFKRVSKLKDFRVGQSTSYFNNLFTEISLRLEALNLDGMLSNSNENFNLTAVINDSESISLKRALAMFEHLNDIKLRETNDLTAMLHYRLSDSFTDYRLADLIGACQLMQEKQHNFTLRTVNKKAYLRHNDEIYIYRRKKVIASYVNEPQTTVKIATIEETKP
ncbi:hypothetical protein [Colwellia sp. E2M01]|uniref:hypothetical protein n=1 Tax=Colwellia sp. E2M01 TaxID=2841561 RepID=UPI001C091EB5|nr:hypothetical protein [Colwellia sp. E2M01]MBU2871364.1 hypothetical protein [Colwellia sp. E2M01]